MKINWQEVFKFLSGVTLAVAVTSLYLYSNNVSVPFMSYEIKPELMGLRGAVGFGLFLVFFYLGFLKKKK